MSQFSIENVENTDEVVELTLIKYENEEKDVE